MGRCGNQASSYTLRCHQGFVAGVAGTAEFGQLDHGTGCGLQALRGCVVELLHGVRYELRLEALRSVKEAGFAPLDAFWDVVQKSGAPDEELESVASYVERNPSLLSKTCVRARGEAVVL